MKCEPEADAGVIVGRGMERGDIGPRVMRGFKRGGAHFDGLRLAADREYRQQAVAHVFEHFAALFDDRRHLAIEITIEEIEQRLRWQPVRQRGEAAHIGEPDRRVDLLGEAAADLAGQHAGSGVLADIGRQHIMRDPVIGADFGDARQRRGERLDNGKLRIGEAARLLRRL